MSTGSAAFDATVVQQWEQTLSAGHEPDKTISTNLEETRRISKTSLAEGFRRLGYQLGEELGRGGMGLVNVANQQVFDREVAVKRLLGGDTDRDAAMKFFAEALVTAQLEHPHIVPIHDLMANAEGQLQLVMKRVEGLSWRDLLHPRNATHRERAAEFTLDDHLDILLKVCDAMSFAHGRGVLHRDLKPENVMIGGYGEVLVMDWGCAVAFGERAHHPVVPRVDEVTQIAGTPCYMAPEMVLIQADRIGPHSDVYLLGATLYEVLTLTKPNRGGDIYAVLRDAAYGIVVPPADAAPGRTIPDELADICLAALVKDPAERIREVSVLTERLRDYRRHAQAVALVTAVRTHLSAAVAQPRAAAAHLRKAVSGAEQALEIWPGWPTAKTILLTAVLADARCHLAAGAASLAATEADRAATLARELGDRVQADAAKSLGGTARSAAKNQAARQQQVRVARIGAVGAAVLLVVGLSIFLVVLNGQQQRTAEALAKAETALAALKTEQVGRSGDQKTSAPALVAQARKAMAVKDWTSAITALQTAIAFDGTLVEAHQLLTNVLAAAKRYGEAEASGAQWLTVANGDPTATKLISLSRILDGKPDQVKATETQIQLADLFEQQQLYILAETTAIPPAKRLAIYRKHIDAAWPGAGASVTMRDDGRMVAAGWTANAQGFQGRRDVLDLEAIRGMPFAELDLSGSGVKSLAPLAGMALEVLNISATQVTDLAPLHGMRLQRMNFCDTRISDLTPLAGMPLTHLWAYNTPLSDLSPLHGMPLVDVNLISCRISDLTPLADSPLAALQVGDGITDLRALRGRPLEILTIFGKGDLDLSPLSGAPLSNPLGVSILTTGTIDLSPLPAGLLRLHLTSARLKNPSTLARFRLQALSLDGYRDDYAPDLQQCNGARLGWLNISHCNKLDLRGLSAPHLGYLSVTNNGDLDLAPLASCPLATIEISHPSPATWRSLAAFRTSASLTTIISDGTKLTAAEFWAGFRQEAPGVSRVNMVAGQLAAITPSSTAPGLAWAVMDGIKASVDELAHAATVGSGASAGIVLGRPFPEFRGERFSGYLTVPTGGEYTFTVTSDDGSRLLLGNQVVVDNDGLHAATPASGRIRLTAGAHPLTILYFNAAADASLTVSVSGPDLPDQPIPAAWLSH